MQISWLGYSAFRVSSGRVTILINPYDQAANFKIHKQGADIIVSSNTRPEIAKVVSGSPFIITEPGEYEVKSVYIHGRSWNGHTLYLITTEDITLACIGPVKMKELSGKQLELIEGVDMLIVPVGGGPTCSAKEAVQVINQIEPRIVIPSYYKLSGSKGLSPISAFLKEYSAPHEEVEKLKINKKDLIQEDTRVVILKRV